MEVSMNDSTLLLLLAVLFGLIFGGLGLALLLVGLASRRKAQASSGWPATRGTILVAEVREQSDSDEDGYSSTSYRPYVQYEYKASGSTLQSSQLTFGGTVSGTRGWAQKALQAYTPGASVMVYYNPSKPSEAVLDRKAGGFTLFVGVGVVFLLIGLGALCLGSLSVFL
jgi:hypothetical protein